MGNRELLSSQTTFLFNRLIPVAWLTLMTLILIGNRENPESLVGGGLIGLFGVIMFVRNDRRWPTAWLHEDALVLQSFRRERRIPLAAIHQVTWASIGFNTKGSQKEVIVVLAEHPDLPRKVRFLLPMNYGPSRPEVPQVVQKLREAAAKAKSAAPAA